MKLHYQVLVWQVDGDENEKGPVPFEALEAAYSDGEFPADVVLAFYREAAETFDKLAQQARDRVTAIETLEGLGDAA